MANTRDKYGFILCFDDDELSSTQNFSDQEGQDKILEAVQASSEYPGSDNCHQEQLAQREEREV